MMKKLLVTTTALTFSAGFAAAEVTVGGFGYVGVVSSGGVTTVQQQVRLEFTGTTTTTAGTSFEAYVRLDVAGAGAPAPAFTRSRITVKHDNLTVAFGNTHGAMNTLAHHEVGGGFNDWGIYYFTNSASTQWDAGNNVMARYDAGNFSVAVSSDIGFAVQEIAAKYSANGLSVGAGVDTTGFWQLTAGYETGNWTLGAGYNSANVATAGVGYKMGAWDFNAAIVNDSAGFMHAPAGLLYGVDVGYDLGGSVRLSASAASGGGVTTIGAGAFFNF